MGGLTLTERARGIIPEAVREEIARTSPIRRILLPEEVAPIVVFVRSPVITAINGEIIRASGGIGAGLIRGW